MPEFHVTAPGGSYPAVVERGAISRIPEFVPDRCGKVFVISNEDVWNLHGARVREALGDGGFDVLFFPAGEENKRFGPVEELAERMVELGADRSSLIVAFGGGIATDMAGFLAAIFMRGIPVIQIPTTLLSQVDAGVGGKTGVNLAVGKNLIGSFHQPLAVLIDPDVLKSLPDREFRAGLYEIVKTGVIAEEALFDFLASRREAVLARDPGAVEHVIAESVRIKCEVVSEDERESGLRRILNFGHTFGHALESETRYSRFLHGEAVAWGMRAATYLALTMGMLARVPGERIVELIDAYGPIPSLAGVRSAALAERMLHDKKTIQKRVHFILPVRIGEVAVCADIPEPTVRAAMERALEEMRA
jgi:3-dehydroquinate synthase